ncbi:MAG: nucleoside 2-deoxyribosyltransferase [Betaproteobacteria bacterium]|nr:nucleoside 2-deoxyribosyltransferase [Betaproteobacteria bacterium]
MKLYLAGPDVFRPDAAAWAGQVRELCLAAGHQALIPLEGDGPATAAAIYRSNLRQIAAADAMLANLNPFRGAEPDSGTCVEIGYALALGKPVIGYADDLRPLRERLRASGPGADGRWRDAAGHVVEDFGLPFNLMLAVPLPLVQGGIAAALRAVGAERSRPV